MAQSQRSPSFLNTYVALRSMTGKFLANTNVFASTSAVSPVSRITTPACRTSRATIEVGGNGFHCAPDLNFADRMHPRLDHQDRVIGIEIDNRVEVLLVYRLVRPFDQLRYRMVLHVTFHKVIDVRARRSARRLCDAVSRSASRRRLVHRVRGDHPRPQPAGASRSTHTAASATTPSPRSPAFGPGRARRPARP